MGKYDTTKEWSAEKLPLEAGHEIGAGCDRDASARRSATACSASPENERYLWMQLENARLERERARAALREIREGIMNEEENGLWEADVILSIIDRALSPEKLSPPNEKLCNSPGSGASPKEKTL